MQVFLSHATEDSSQAQQIAQELGARGVEVWLTDREILPGDDWGQRVHQALKASQAMIVLLSTNSARSLSVQRELLYALSEHKYAKRLVPVLIENTDDIPWILRKLQIVDLVADRQGALDPIAQALRPSQPALSS